MSDTPQGLQAAIASALQESQYPTEDQADLESWNSLEQAETTPAEEPPASPVGDGTEPGTAETPTTETATSEGEEVTEESVPEEFWGVDLRGIPAPQRQAIIDKMQGQEGYIHRLQEKLATKPGETPPEDAPDDRVDIDQVSDEELLKAAGYDPTDFQIQQAAAFLVPMLRNQLKLEEQVETLNQAKVVEETANYWESGLDELESNFGKLPFERVEVLRFALDEGIATPYELYFRIAAPVRQEVSQAAAEARREAAKQASGGSPKPRSTATSTDNAPVAKGTNLRDAVKQAMVSAEKSTGHKWKDAIFGRVNSGSE